MKALARLQEAAVVFAAADHERRLARQSVRRLECHCTEYHSWDSECNDLGIPPCWMNPDDGLCDGCALRAERVADCNRLSRNRNRALRRMRYNFERWEREKK